VASVQNLNFQSSGTRPDSHSHEKTDCTVWAISNATGIPYTDVHKMLSLRGRKDGQPFDMASALNSLMGLYRVKSVQGDYTIGRFTRTKGKSGRFIVRVTYRNTRIGHVYAVVDGVVHDGSAPTRGNYERLRQIWELIATESLATPVKG
jgi:hypothetical protein